jgi:hypothetical protein
MIRLDRGIFSDDYLENVEYQLIGHYHLKRTVTQNSIYARHVTVDKKILMPAFGGYTGGLGGACYLNPE